MKGQNKKWKNKRNRFSYEHCRDCTRETTRLINYYCTSFGNYLSQIIFYSLGFIRTGWWADAQNPHANILLRIYDIIYILCIDYNYKYRILFIS